VKRHSLASPSSALSKRAVSRGHTLARPLRAMATPLAPAFRAKSTITTSRTQGRSISRSAAASRRALAHEAVVAEDAARPTAEMADNGATEYRVILGHRATSLPFTAVLAGSQRTTTGNSRVSMTCSVLSRRRSQPCPIWLWEQVVSQSVCRSCSARRSAMKGFGDLRALNAGPGTSAVLSKTKQASAEPMGQLGRRSDEPDCLVAETGCPCSVGSKERCHNRILHITWRADRV
jgi:hypothetical protein